MLPEGSPAPARYGLHLQSHTDALKACTRRAGIGGTWEGRRHHRTKASAYVDCVSSPHQVQLLALSFYSWPSLGCFIGRKQSTERSRMLAKAAELEGWV